MNPYYWIEMLELVSLTGDCELIEALIPHLPSGLWKPAIEFIPAERRKNWMNDLGAVRDISVTVDATMRLWNDFRPPKDSFDFSYTHAGVSYHHKSRVGLAECDPATGRRGRLLEVNGWSHLFFEHYVAYRQDREEGKFQVHLFDLNTRDHIWSSPGLTPEAYLDREGLIITRQYEADRHLLDVADGSTVGTLSQDYKDFVVGNSGILTKDGKNWFLLSRGDLRILDSGSTLPRHQEDLGWISDSLFLAGGQLRSFPGLTVVQDFEEQLKGISLKPRYLSRWLRLLHGFGLLQPALAIEKFRSSMRGSLDEEFDWSNRKPSRFGVSNDHEQVAEHLVRLEITQDWSRCTAQVNPVFDRMPPGAPEQFSGLLLAALERVKPATHNAGWLLALRENRVRDCLLALDALPTDCPLAMAIWRLLSGEILGEEDQHRVLPHLLEVEEEALWDHFLSQELSQGLLHPLIRHLFHASSLAELLLPKLTKMNLGKTLNLLVDVLVGTPLSPYDVRPVLPIRYWELVKGLWEERGDPVYRPADARIGECSETDWTRLVEGCTAENLAECLPRLTLRRLVPLLSDSKEWKAKALLASECFAQEPLAELQGREVALSTESASFADWNEEELTLNWRGPSPERITWPVGFSSSGTALAGVLDGALCLWHVDSETPMWTRHLNGDSLVSLQFNHHGSYLLVHLSRSFLVLDTENGTTCYEERLWDDELLRNPDDNIFFLGGSVRRPALTLGKTKLYLSTFGSRKLIDLTTGETTEPSDPFLGARDQLFRATGKGAALDLEELLGVGKARRSRTPGFSSAGDAFWHWEACEKGEELIYRDFRDGGDYFVHISEILGMPLLESFLDYELIVTEFGVFHTRTGDNLLRATGGHECAYDPLLSRLLIRSQNGLKIFCLPDPRALSDMELPQIRARLEEAERPSERALWEIALHFRTLINSHR